MWISWLAVMNPLSFINVIYTWCKYFIKCKKITYVKSCYKHNLCVCARTHTHVILWIYIYLEQSQNYANFEDIMLKNWIIFFYYNSGITGVELKNIGVVIRVKKNQINIFKVYVGWYASWYIHLFQWED